MKRRVSLLILVLAIAFTASQRVNADDAARGILDKAIAAVGGQGRLNTLKAPTQWMETGTFHGQAEPAPFIAQYASKWPNWYRQKVENAFSIGIAGETAFMAGPEGENKTSLSGEVLSEQLKQARIAWARYLFPLKGKDYELSSIPGVVVDGRPTIGLKASHRDGRDVKFYFDEESFLIAKIETEVVSPQIGPEPVKSEAYFSDHRSFGGPKMPHKYNLLYDGKLFVEAEIEAIKVHATIDPAWFESE